MAEEDAEFLTSKNKPLLFFENRLFRVVGENVHNLNVYYLCNTNSRIKCNGRVIKLSVSGEIVRSKPCIDTCHQLSEEKILAIAVKERLFAFRAQPPHTDRSNLECYNEIRTSLSEENLGALFYMDSFSTLRSSLQRWRRGVHPHVPQSYNEIPSMETFPYFYTRNKSDEETFLFLVDRIYIPPEWNNGTAH